MARELEKQEQQNLSLANINRICQGTEIVGNIKTSGDIRLDGILEGNLFAKGKLVIGGNGKIKGDIDCRTADVVGIVEGSLNVAEVVNLKSSANIKGTITTMRIGIEAGAVFNGTCTMPEQKNTGLLTKK